VSALAALALLLAVAPAEKQPRPYALLTLASGHTFRVLNSGPMLDDTGKRVALAISYLSSAQNPRQLDADADELFEYLRPHAEHQNDKDVVVIARLSSTGESVDLDVLYERQKNGRWKKTARARKPFPRIPPRPQGDDRDVEAERAASQDATAWLALLDKGELEETWDTSAPFLRERATRPQWIQSGNAMRAALGKALSRKQIAIMETDSVPTAPPGHYVVVEYRSKFAQEPLAFESVTEMLCDDGKWRVAGYSVR
jgi:hypothetical protein